MGVIKDYFKYQLQWQMFMLEHEDVSEFYLSPFQRNRSAVPLLFVRTIICLGSIGILISSVIYDIMPFGYWPTFLTHWGLVLNTIAAAFGVIVSARAYLRGPIDATFGLPRYVKMYWAMTNIATVVAFFITVFYWSFLTDEVDENTGMNKTVDVFMHAVNTVLMLVLLLSSRQPMHLLHVYQPVSVPVIFLIFSVIYYFAGGTNAITGGSYIYPPLDWSQPGIAMITVALSLVLLIVLHAVCVLLTLGRDVLGRRLLRDNNYPVTVGNYGNFKSP
ncbi:PREDICTED: protein rolling stone-like [Papilio polytes]|uniref:protein rolling stone-like n=1 Tax=Papilio polytes TaxID=76194 RepID=UPI000675FF92|nr:PREDICTED: protein rolling stone-like [Papilio polytes]